MVVSLSMLSLGFSGLMLAIFRNFFKKNRDTFVFVGGFAFSLVLPVVFYLNQRLPLDYLYLVWDWHQLVYLAVSYLLFGLPFLIISCILALFFLKHPKKANQVYAVNLVGSGLGIFISVVIMHYLPPELYLFAAAAFGALISLSQGLNNKKLRPKLIAGLVFLAVISVNILLVPSSLVPQMSEYKGLPAILRLPETKIVDYHYSPRGVLHVAEGEMIRIARGLSLTHRDHLPRQKALTFDGSSPSPIFRPNQAKESFFDNQIFSAAYKLKPNPEVLLVGAGGFSGVMLAEHHQASSIKVLEINPEVITALEKNMPESFFRLQQEAGVEIAITDARSYIEKTGRKFDLIQLNPAGTLNSSAAGLYSQNEDYLNTVESYQLFIERLKPEGILLISRWMATPAKDGLKLFATGLRALETLGVENPADNLVLIRNWDIISLMVKREPFRDFEIESLKDFCSMKHFDISYLPKTNDWPVNRFHVLPEPVYYLASQNLINSETKEAFFTDYLFNIRPATDDKPYFSHFFKWSALPHLIETMGREWIPFSEHGYLVLLATFAQSILIGGVVILLPLGFLIAKYRKKNKKRFKTNTWYYFIFLGLAFMILEMSLIQKFILFLHDPIYSASIVIGTFLLISGIGSMLSKKLVGKQMKFQMIPFVIIFLLSGAYAFFLDGLFSQLMSLDFYLKLLLSIAIISPLALLLGIPFPLGMQKISSTGEANTGIAWGCNGFFSVVGAILTGILTITWGSQIVILIGGLCYPAALIMWTLRFDS